MSLQQTLLKILSELDFFYSDLNRLIVDYISLIPFAGNRVQSITVHDSWKLATDQNYLYVCQWGSRCVGRYTLDTLQLIDKINLDGYGATADIYNNELYVSDWTALKVFNLDTKKMVRQWTPPQLTT